MQTVRVDIPAELVVAAGLDVDDLSAEAAWLLALELYREDRVSLGRAAELCHLPVERVLEFASLHNVPLTMAPTTWRRIAGLWRGWDCRSSKRFAAPSAVDPIHAPTTGHRCGHAAEEYVDRGV